jgi:zinc/manganese transport system ATP-binding protein
MTAMAISPRPDTDTRKGAALTFEGAAVRLGGRTIWSDVSLTVAEADFVAVLGPNGAGKSTLIKAILGLLPLAAGSASVLGRQPGDAKARIGVPLSKPCRWGR